MIITAEKNKSKRFQRILVRLPKETHRLYLTTAPFSKMMRTLLVNFPEMEDVPPPSFPLPSSSYFTYLLFFKVKFHQVKSDEMESWNKALLLFESKLIETNYKFGVLYAKEGQTTEEEFLNNGKAAFMNFLFV